MSKIFISYRREDSGDIAPKIYQRLAARFGQRNVFLDVHSIPLGDDFPSYIGKVLEQCVVQLVVIGDRWATVVDGDGRLRLSDEKDLVRIEVEEGLRRDIAIPILVHGVKMEAVGPLPASLEPLRTRNATSCGPDPALDSGFSRLMRRIEEKLPPPLALAQANGWENKLPRSMAQLGFQYCQSGEIDYIMPPSALVAAGSVQMGSEAVSNEQPVHELEVADFSIALHPVTVAEYALFLEHNPSRSMDATGWQNQRSKSDHPVVNVSWDDAVAYASWLSEVRGQIWRLASEAEWEKAAAWDTDGKASRVYPWGNKFDMTYCNTEESGKRSTTRVGTYPRGASPYGLHDMSGNVWEWTNSLYGEYPYDATDGREQMSARGQRVRRGGSWLSYAGIARSSKRLKSWPDHRDQETGFRLALGLPAYA